MIARELGRKQHPVSHAKVAPILHGLHYSLQSHRKTEEGAEHPDHDGPFRHINVAVKNSLAQGLPVISVDTKKKELIGNTDNAGQQWLPAKQPKTVQGHDFPDPEISRVIPMVFTTSDVMPVLSAWEPIITPENLPWPPFGGGDALKDGEFIRMRKTFLLQPTAAGAMDRG